MNKETFATYRCPYCRLNEKLFFKDHFIGYITRDEREKISYNEELLIKRWKRDFKYKNNDELKEMVSRKFWESLRRPYKNRYYQPHIFNERIALQCGLTPFIYRKGEINLNLLAGYNVITTAGCRDFVPQLEAYQALTHGTIDRKSYFFHHNEMFKEMFDKKIVEKMNKISNGGN